MSATITHVWKPSCARTIVIDSFVPVPRGTTAISPPLLTWATKDPGDTLDYQLDISPALVGNDGDPIATIQVSISPGNPGDLQVTSMAADGARATFWFTAGQNGITYTVTIVIGTVSGRTLQRSVLLPVLYLSVPPIPADALATDTGVVITDQNGSPIIATPS
jgi:hypothetical protein